MHTDVPVELVSSPSRFISKITEYQSQPELFIDVETSDWWTPNPWVSLLQVWAGNEVSVFDMMVPGMRGVLEQEFIPRVMVNPRVCKWAHNAAYEKRFLGGSRVQKLECTLRMARRIPFHRLPSLRLSLAALAGGARPALVRCKHRQDPADGRLEYPSAFPEHLHYAAADTMWCASVQAALAEIRLPPPPQEDTPEQINDEFHEAKLTELRASAALKALRESVRNFMQEQRLQKFSRFATWPAARIEVRLAAFVAAVEKADPARLLDVEMRVSQQLIESSMLGPEHLLPRCNKKQSRQLRTPRILRPRGEKVEYEVELFDAADRVTIDYEERTFVERLAKSQVAELKQRMVGVLELRGTPEFGAWRVAPGGATYTLDVRDALALSPEWSGVMVPLYKKHQLLLGEDFLNALASDIVTNTSSMLQWRSHGDVFGFEAQYARDWTESEQE